MVKPKYTVKEARRETRAERTKRIRESKPRDIEQKLAHGIKSSRLPTGADWLARMLAKWKGKPLKTKKRGLAAQLGNVKLPRGITKKRVAYLKFIHDNEQELRKLKIADVESFLSKNNS